MTETAEVDPLADLTPEQRVTRMMAIRAAGLIAADRGQDEAEQRADYVLGFRDRFAAMIFETRLTLEQPRDYLHSIALQSLTQGELAAEAFVAAMEELDEAAGQALEEASNA